MKKGISLSELAAEIERQNLVKRDYMATSDLMEMRLSSVDDLLSQVDLPENSNTEAKPLLALKTNGGYSEFGIRPIAHRQLGTYTGVPATYYDRMLNEAPELLVRNINHWLSRQGETKRMIRTLDGAVRAVKSERYRPLDNFDLAQAVLPVLSEYGMSIESCQITERRLYVKAFRSDMEREVEGSKLVGDVVRAGICVSNSEVGDGSLKIEPMVMRLVCTNGQISQDHTMRKTHAGRSQAKSDIQVAYELLSDSTKAKSDEAFWMSVQDLTKATLDGPVFDAQVATLERAAGNKIGGKLEEVVEVTAKKYQLNEDEKGGVLRHLIDGGDLSQWGLANAITRHSQDVEDYDRATDLERLGGLVVELPSKDWGKIATAS